MDSVSRLLTTEDSVTLESLNSDVLMSTEINSVHMLPSADDAAHSFELGLDGECVVIPVAHSANPCTVDTAELP